MSSKHATFVATVHPFIATDRMVRQRRLARQAKARRDPGGFILTKNLVEEVRSAIAGFDPSSRTSVAAWVGCADRLAHVHPSGFFELLTDSDAPDGRGRLETPGTLEFVTLVGPRSYWPEREATAYRAVLAALTCDEAGVERVAVAARELVQAARVREATWSRDEWFYRVSAAIVGWICWDEGPGAAREL